MANGTFPFKTPDPSPGRRHLRFEVGLYIIQADAVSHSLPTTAGVYLRVPIGLPGRGLLLVVASAYDVILPYVAGDVSSGRLRAGTT